jgi:hypothetical protein
MNAFIVDLEDRPGSVAAVAEAIALKGISITSLAGVTGRGAGGAVVLTNDEAGTRRALAEAGFTTREVEVVPHAIEDRPVACGGRPTLADAGVNLEAVLPTGMSEARQMIASPRPTGEARTALGPMAAAGR